jgi:hypothetical protein
MGAGRARKLARLVKAPRMAKSSGSSRGKAAPVRVFPRPVFKLQPRNVVKVSARDLPEADPSAAKTAKWDGVVSSAEKNDTTEATAPIQPLADTQKLEAVHARSPQETPRNVRRSTVRMVPPSLNEKSSEKSESEKCLCRRAEEGTRQSSACAASVGVHHPPGHAAENAGHRGVVRHVSLPRFLRRKKSGAG